MSDTDPNPQARERDSLQKDEATTSIEPFFDGDSSFLEASNNIIHHKRFFPVDEVDGGRKVGSEPSAGEDVASRLEKYFTWVGSSSNDHEAVLCNVSIAVVPHKRENVLLRV
jgi:hypothetical protein